MFCSLCGDTVERFILRSLSDDFRLSAFGAHSSLLSRAKALTVLSLLVCQDGDGGGETADELDVHLPLRFPQGEIPPAGNVEISQNITALLEP